MKEEVETNDISDLIGTIYSKLKEKKGKGGMRSSQGLMRNYSS